MSDGFFQSPGGVSFCTIKQLNSFVCLIFPLSQRLKPSSRKFMDCLGDFSRHAFHFVVNANLEAVFLSFLTLQLFAITTLLCARRLVNEPLAIVTLIISLP